MADCQADTASGAVEKLRLDAAAARVPTMAFGSPLVNLSNFAEYRADIAVTSEGTHNGLIRMNRPQFPYLLRPRRSGPEGSLRT